MDATKKEALLNRFRIYLDSQDEVDTDAQETQEGQGDLYQLYLELSGLRNEVHRESRQVKEAIDHFKGLIASLETNRSELRQEMERRMEVEAQQNQEAIRILLMELLEFRDRLEDGINHLEERHPSWLVQLVSDENEWLSGFREGQEIIRRRLDQILASQGVHPMKSVGEKLDPHHMRAIGITHRNDLEDGIVAVEVRKGFFRNGNVLRPAEVTVNRHTKESLS